MEQLKLNQRENVGTLLTRQSTATRSSVTGRKRRVSWSISLARRSRSHHVSIQAPDGHGKLANSRHGEGDLYGATARFGTQYLSSSRLSSGGRV